MESIKEVLMRRDEMTEDEADELIEEARADLLSRIEEGSMNPFAGDDVDFCQDWFGLEPDYLMELIP